MSILRWKLGLIALAAAGVVAAAPKPECYVVDARGKKHEGLELTVKSSQGDLELNVDGRIRLPFKAGSYRFAFIPKPEEVDTLEKVYEGKRYDAVAKVADPLFEKYKFVGWGDFIAYLEGMSLIQLERPEDALKAFNKGRQFQGRFADELLKGVVHALLAMKASDQLRPMLAKMVGSTRKEDAAFAFNARARLLEDEGKAKEAVLEYLKVLLFFDNSSSTRDFRAEAKTRAVEIMKKMNDGRWKRVETIE